MKTKPSHKMEMVKLSYTNNVGKTLHSDHICTEAKSVKRPLIFFNGS